MAVSLTLLGSLQSSPDLAGFKLPSCKVKEGRGGRKHPRFLPGLTPLPTSINCMRSKAQLELHVCEWNDDVTKWFLSLCVVLMLCQSDGWFVALSVFHADDICRCVKCSAALLHTPVQLVTRSWNQFDDICQKVVLFVTGTYTRREWTKVRLHEAAMTSWQGVCVWPPMVCRWRLSSAAVICLLNGSSSDCVSMTSSSSSSCLVSSRAAAYCNVDDFAHVVCIIQWNHGNDLCLV